jgi:hypothetical protein
MITNFEEITEELTAEELAMLKPLMNGLKIRGSSNPIKAPDIAKAMLHYGYPKFTEVKLRKFVNHIRTKGLLPLIATSKGYYCTNDQEHIKKQIESLEQRARSIMASADGIKQFLK